MGRDERWLAERSHAELGLEEAWIAEQVRRQESSPVLRRGPSRGALYRIEACNVDRRANRLVADFRAVAFGAKGGGRAVRPTIAGRAARTSRRVAKAASSDDDPGPSEPHLAEAHAEGGTA